MKPDQLRSRVDEVLEDCEELLKSIDTELNASPEISFKQAKEIENTILRLQKQVIAMREIK